MLYLPTASRAEMESEIVAEKSLYAMFDEMRLLNEEYETEEIRDIIQRWIEQGDETAGFA